MTKNVGQIDRWLRIVVGLALLALPFVTEFAIWQSSVATVLAVAVGLVLIATAGARFCPAYWLFGLRTCRKDA